MLGRNVTMARARSATDIGTLEELVDLSGRFERLMVIQGSFAVLVAGCSPRGRRVSRARGPTGLSAP